LAEAREEVRRRDAHLEALRKAHEEDIKTIGNLREKVSLS
jgi:hypothetical protein